jgi:hypothetical protein
MCASIGMLTSPNLWKEYTDQKGLQDYVDNFSLRCLSSMFNRRDTSLPLVLFVIPVIAYLPINLINLPAACTQLTPSVIGY